MKTPSKFLILNYDEAIIGAYSYVAAKNFDGRRASKRKRDPNAKLESRRIASILMTKNDVALAEQGLQKAGTTFDEFKMHCTVVDDKGQLLASVVKGDNLYVVAHGCYFGADDAPTGKVLIETSYLDESVEAGGLRDLLVNDLHLPNEKINLKLFICRSAGGRPQFEDERENHSKWGNTVMNTVAGKIASSLRHTHPEISVYGYVGGCSLTENGKLAGMRSGNRDSGHAHDYKQTMDDYLDRWQ